MKDSQNPLQISMPNREEFLTLFHPPHIDKHPVKKKIELSLFIRKLEGNNFEIQHFHTVLGNAAMSYVLSRNRFENINSTNAHEITKKVMSSFRKTEENSGEAGELLLYCFLESHLKAPKILSKMELKTAANDYVKGADGVHLYEHAPGKYHLIFGEAKMISNSTSKNSSLTSAITQAINSIEEVEAKGLSKEIELIDANLMKESLSDEAFSYIKDILIPNGQNAAVKQNAFGIFVGFEIDTTNWKIVELETEEFENRIKTEVVEAVESRYKHIIDKIVEKNLDGYHFYIYVTPFIKDSKSNIDSARKNIINAVA